LDGPAIDLILFMLVATIPRGNMRRAVYLFLVTITLVAVVTACGCGSSGNARYLGLFDTVKHEWNGASVVARDPGAFEKVTLGDGPAVEPALADELGAWLGDVQRIRCTTGVLERSRIYLDNSMSVEKKTLDGIRALAAVKGLPESEISARFAALLEAEKAAGQKFQKAQALVAEFRAE
jgi:hypothetical protein